MFIGRKRELAALEDFYQRDGFEFPVIYGRRRVGKTRLIQEFIQDKDAIYFMATEQTAKEQLRNLTRAVGERQEDSALQYAAFDSFDRLFSYITEISRDKRIVFVIDEYPYLAKAVPEISSILQKYIDLEWQQTKLYLILCGSSMSFMERQVLGYQSPLYGRRTGQLKLQALPYYEALQFFRDWQDEEKLLAYGVAGGIPLYLNYLSQYKNLEEAIEGEFLSISGHLQEEPLNLMLQELREPAGYNSILTAIANGASRQNDIATAVGKESSRLPFYLNNLMDLGIVVRKQPLESKSNKKGIYRIADNLYRFWYRFIPACASLIAIGRGELAWKKAIQPHFSEYFGPLFEDICMQYLQYQMMNGRMEELYLRYGSWWGNNPAKKREEEIDIVCADDTDILCGECKWKNEALDLPVLERLRERSALIQKGRKVHYALFSKSGFTKSVKEQAQKDGILLADMEKLML